MHRISLVNESYQLALAARPQDKVNPALTVATVNFQDHQGQVLGVLLTPWFLGLLLMPEELEGWRDHQIGDAHTENFPAGDFEFTHGWDPKFGAFGCSKIFSTMGEFSDQAAALRIAERAIQQLFIAAAPEVLVADSSPIKAVPDAVTDVDPDLELQAKSQRQGRTDGAFVADDAIDMKRRGLLTGALFGRK
ncbi:MAG: [NiFe]-hydrogenase assembly chaperone HybE [Motiliproteus sp.]